MQGFQSHFDEMGIVIWIIGDTLRIQKNLKRSPDF